MDSRNNLSNVHNLLKLVKETTHTKISDTESQRKGAGGTPAPHHFLEQKIVSTLNWKNEFL